MRHGLIDVQGVLDVIKAQQADISVDNAQSSRGSARRPNHEEGQQALPPRSGARKAKSSDKLAWKKAMKVLAKNPQLLMESVPSVWE